MLAALVSSLSAAAAAADGSWMTAGWVVVVKDEVLWTRGDPKGGAAVTVVPLLPVTAATADRE